MLHEFLAQNHDELVKRCSVKVAGRSASPPSASEPEYGIPLLLDQLVSTLRKEQTSQNHDALAALPADIGNSAGKHGNELLRKGFTVEQVVHDYGDLCQALTELAHEKNAPITVNEFHTFNRCLDNAIADAVTEFGRQRDREVFEDSARTMNERLGFLAHELRNSLNSAMLAFQAIKGSNATVGGATGAVLGRSLIGLRDLIDRSLADVRLTDGLHARREQVFVRALLDDLQIAAAMEAKARGLAFTITAVDHDLAIDADRQMVSSAVSNLLQNALKFTREGGHVSVTAHASADRVLIEVEDECGGLPPGKTEELFHPFEQRSADRTGLGLGCPSLVAVWKRTKEGSTCATSRARDASSRSICLGGVTHPNGRFAPARRSRPPDHADIVHRLVDALREHGWNCALRGSSAERPLLTRSRCGGAQHLRARVPTALSA